MQLKSFTATIKHDQGEFTISSKATSKEEFMKMIKIIENCPESAISIQETGYAPEAKKLDALFSECREIATGAIVKTLKRLQIFLDQNMTEHRHEIEIKNKKREVDELVDTLILNAALIHDKFYLKYETDQELFEDAKKMLKMNY